MKRADRESARNCKLTLDVPFIGTATAGQFFLLDSTVVSNDVSSQTQPKSTTLPEESSEKAKPRPEAAKWRVGNLLQAFAPKKKTTSDGPLAVQEGSVRPVIGPDKAALFLDSAGKIVSAQPRCAGFFGRHPEELSGLNIKELLKAGFDQEVTNLLAKGQEASEQAFHVLAVRKDGSEFATQLSFKFLPEDFGFCWTVFIQAPPGYSDVLAGQNGDLKPIVAATETATQGETPKSGSGAKRAALRPPGPSETARVEGGRIARMKFEADKRLRQIQKDYGDRLIQLEQDLSAERELNENLSKKLEGLQTSPIGPQEKHTRAEENEFSRKQLAADLEKEREANKLAQKKAEELNAQLQKLQKAGEQAEARVRESAARCSDWEKKVAELTNTADELTRSRAARQSAGAQSEQRVKELEQRLKDATEASAKAKAELDNERDANKRSRQKAEELNTQVQKLQQAAEEAEARVRESAGLSKDWEKKVGEFKKNFDELTRNHAAEKSAAGQSAQRIKELEQQLKDAAANVGAGKTEAEKQIWVRQRLEAENRNLTEASGKAKLDLDKEREANKLLRKKEEELDSQVQKLQKAAEQAEARLRESAAESRDWEKKAADLKKNLDELTRGHAGEKTAAAQSAQRVKELERQMERAGEDLAASKTEIEEAESRARESAAHVKDWEKKAADLKKTVDDLTKSHSAEKSAVAQSAQRVKELEQQLKRAGEDIAAGKAEVEKQQAARKRVEAMNRELFDSNSKATANVAEWTEKQASFEKKASELEQRARQSVFSLAKANAELENQRVERERAEKELEKLKDKLKRQVDSERGSKDKIAELEKTIQDRGDDLARASAALRKESKERQVAQKQSRLVSDMGSRLETNLASLEDAKKAFEISLNQKDEHLQTAERSLSAANSNLEKETAERRRLQELLTETTQQLEKVSTESKVEISRLQAALDLGELQRKQLQVDLLRTRGAGMDAELKSESEE